MTRPFSGNQIDDINVNYLVGPNDFALKYRQSIGIGQVRNDPNIFWPANCNGVQYLSVPYHLRYPKFSNIQTIPEGPYVTQGALGPTKMALDEVNRIASIAYAMRNSQLFGMSPPMAYTPHSVNAGDVAKPEALRAAWDALSALHDNLSQWDGWFDSNGICSRSCQVNCQTGCQVSCQSCNGSNCHNQKCGAH